MPLFVMLVMGHNDNDDGCYMQESISYGSKSSEFVLQLLALKLEESPGEQERKLHLHNEELFFMFYFPFNNRQ